ncbi:MAG: division/cell wall cluster transcriptional repressor MraZ [Desulfobacteraceae bacterium]|jgi:MraZ protein|nr:division/cell wall cluster transcriptional repressor MraZ [Desulfobacteraceae bacterium]
MFLGEYELRIDHKGRVAIPAKFRDAFRAGLVLSRGFDKCLIVYTMAEWEIVADELVSLPVTQLNPRRIARFTFSGAFDLEPDRQGRIILPPALRQYADIDDEVVMVGSYSHLQIWAREHWSAEKQFMAEHAAEIAEAVNI